MLRVGLTGSIAVGKSFVTDTLRELGCHVIDADNVAKHAVEIGSPALKAIVHEFGSEILQEDGTLDRARLGAIVFADANKRLKLNSLVHPFVIAEQDLLLQDLETRYGKGIAVVDAALMIESGSYERFDKLIVVHCRPEVQLERLKLRNNLTTEEAQKRIASQMGQDEKKKFADYLIDTSNGFEATRDQVREVYEDLKRLAE